MSLFRHRICPPCAGETKDVILGAWAGFEQPCFACQVRTTHGSVIQVGVPLPKASKKKLDPVRVV